jgi:aminoglycoside 6'-N-acetyltransferase I
VTDRPACTISDLSPHDSDRIEQTAVVLIEAFKDSTDSWSDYESALAEIHESFQDDRISLIALDADGAVAGWIGGIRAYGGHAWELHPLAVRPDRQRRGIGRRLVAALEERVRQLGGTTVYLGTDDETARTSLAGDDLYPDVLQRLARIRNLSNHPFRFYQRCGYTITGVIPDANGPGKPDILMAKRLAGDR